MPDGGRLILFVALDFAYQIECEIIPVDVVFLQRKRLLGIYFWCKSRTWWSISFYKLVISLNIAQFLWVISDSTKNNNLSEHFFIHRYENVVFIAQYTHLCFIACNGVVGSFEQASGGYW